MSQTRKKLKVVKMKQLLNKDTITRVDENTFYVPSNEPDREGEPYFVFNSVGSETHRGLGWTCDCMNWTLNCKDTNNADNPHCKHIKAILTSFDM